MSLENEYMEEDCKNVGSGDVFGRNILEIVGSSDKNELLSNIKAFKPFWLQLGFGGTSSKIDVLAILLEL